MSDSSLPAPTESPLAEGGANGVIVHIPAVLDQVTGDPIPLHVEATVVITGPAGLMLTFNRIADNILTSTVGFNLFIPVTSTGTLPPGTRL